MQQKANIVILGGGESGIGAALLAKQQGADVFLSDKAVLPEEQVAELKAAGIDFESGGHTLERILQATEVIKSPGIPDHIPLLQTVRERGIPIIGEIEYAARYTSAPLLAITGSNGKTTTVHILHHLLNEAGIEATLAGNVGLGFARAVAEAEEEPMAYVLELSSFQLDSIDEFRPQLSAILNITPDHLDRYNYQMDGYIDSKLRITMNQQEDDHFWYLASDENVAKGRARAHIRAQQHALDTEHQIDGHRILVDGTWIDLNKTLLKGRHNAMNALFAAEMAAEMGVTVEDITIALESFKPVPHRLEPVGTLHGVQYINDSKATNVDAVTFALAAMDKPVVWLAGGTDKGNDYSVLNELVANKVKALIAIGVDNSKLRDAFAGQLAFYAEAESINEALQLASEQASSGDVVLLSPACASFDRFKNYIDRGDQFRAAVQQMIQSQNPNK